MRKSLNILMIICLAAFMSCQKEDLTPVSLQGDKMSSELIDINDVQINYGGSDHDDDGGINYGGSDHDDEEIQKDTKVILQGQSIHSKTLDSFEKDSGGINYGGSDHDDEGG